MRLRRWIITMLGAGLGLLGDAPLAVADPPGGGTADAPARQGTPPSWPDEVIILNGAADLSDFWTRLARPDLIITRPGPTPGTGVPARPGASRTHTVSAVKLQGRVDEDLARLRLEVELVLLEAGATWVPLGVDFPVISFALEGDRELELRRTPRGIWEARLEGAGPHRLQCGVELPLRVSPERKRLELAIPEALSTSFELDVPHQAFEVDLGTGEAIGTTPIPGGKGTRISAHVSPRSRLALEWSDQGGNAAATPFLAAKLEIAIEADSEWVTTQSSWEIRCIRGVARSLEIRLDEPDIVQLLKLDDQYLVERIERNVLTIPLREPLRARGVRLLTLQTRRAISPGTPRRFESTGFSLANAVEQSGAIGITPASGVWINPGATRGLRRIDPQELPKDLRTRPGISLAYQFVDQPFRLGLEVEEAPPLFRTATRSVIALDGDLGRTETTIGIERVRGRLFDVEVEMPPGLELGLVEPAEYIESVIPVGVPEGTAARQPAPSAGRVVRLHLSPSARDQRSLTLRLQGQQRIGEGGPVRLGVFAPRGGVTMGNSLTISAARDTSFEVLGMAEPSNRPLVENRDFQVQSLPEPSPAGAAAAADAPIAVLTSQHNPVWVEGRLVRHPRSLSFETDVDAQVSASGIEVSQETTVRVRHGEIRTLLVSVPLGRNEPWQVFQGKAGVRREELAREDGKGGRYRLTFDPPVGEATTLQFRYRLPLPEGPASGKQIDAEIRWAAPEEGVPGRLRLAVGSTPDLRVSVPSRDWIAEPDEPEQTGVSKGSRRYRLAERAGGKPQDRLPISVQAVERLAMPPVVAARALLRSAIGTDRQARTRAWYWVESHPAELTFQLPAGSRWLRARLDGRPVEQLEAGPGVVGLRMLLPPEAQSKPVLVELEYQSPAAASGPELVAPELDREAVVLQSFWMVQVPWSRAVVGVPPAWTDENEWYWDTYVWKRRPMQSLAGLTGWVSGASSPAPEDPQGDEQDDAHAYLFGRCGAPGSLPVAVASRAWLVAICSGAALIGGFLLMYTRLPSLWAWIAASAVGLAMAVFAHPSVVVLVLQSSLFGVILALVGFGMRGLLERGRPAGPVGVPSASALSTGQSGLAAAGGPSGVGSDDSTAIRVRVTPSTMDHVAAPLVLAPADPEPAGSPGTGSNGGGAAPAAAPRT